MTIQLKPEQEKFILEKIASGEYSNADDVISDAFKMLDARERKITELKAKIAVGTQQIANGQLTDGEIVFEKLQHKISQFQDLRRNIISGRGRIYSAQQFSLWKFCSNYGPEISIKTSEMAIAPLL